MASIPIFYNIRNLKVRKATTVMTSLGIALTVAVLLWISMLVNGLRSALSVTGDPLSIVVMRQGSTSELVSVVSDEKYQALETLDGVARLDGEPMVSNEVVTVVTLPLRGDPTQEGNINLRGISPMGVKMRDIEIIEGRMFEEGTREIIVGRGLHAVRANTEIGDTIEFGRGVWEIVGIFDAGESAYNSEIWAPGALTTTDLGRGSSRSSAFLRAQDGVAAQALINRISDDQRLLLDAQLERDYYAEQTSSGDAVQGLGLFVAAIMAIGSCFAAMNTMYTAVARRNREIGVLQMLGFSRWSIMVSFVAESLLLSLFGGIIGCLLVLPINGWETRIGNWVTFSETTFEFQLSPEIMGAGILFAAMMGILGGLLPARFASRKDILSALRDL